MILFDCLCSSDEKQKYVSGVGAVGSWVASAVFFYIGYANAQNDTILSGGTITAFVLALGLFLAGCGIGYQAVRPEKGRPLLLG